MSLQIVGLSPAGVRERGRVSDDDPAEQRCGSIASSWRRACEPASDVIDLTRLRLDDAPVLAAASALPQDTGEDPPRDAAVAVADLVAAGRYIPAGAGYEPIAGDFYDLLKLGEDRLAIVVGDITGHGSAAAGRMRRLRAAARAAALEGVGPAAVLAALDALLDQNGEEWLATLWYGEYVPSTGRLTYASAGHPPPVLTCHGDPTRLLELADAPPLGTGQVHARERTLRLPAGGILIAYSDGLVERHDADLSDQLALLRGLVTVHCDPALTRTAEQIADAILAALVPDPAQARDDVCLMVVRRQPQSSSGAGTSAAGQLGGRTRGAR